MLEVSESSAGEIQYLEMAPQEHSLRKAWLDGIEFIGWWCSVLKTVKVGGGRFSGVIQKSCTEW